MTEERNALIKWLNACVERELEKPENEIDITLINECEKFIAELSGDTTSFSDEELSVQLERLKSKAGKIKIRKRFNIRILAACITTVTLLLGICVTAYAMNPSFREWIISVINLPVGSEISDGNITYKYMGKNQKYAALDDFISAENLDILMPHKLPDGILIESVIKNDLGNGSFIYFKFNNEKISMVIEINSETIFNPSIISTKYEVNKTVFYILSEENTYTASALKDGNVYYITSNDYNLLLEILNSLS